MLSGKTALHIVRSREWKGAGWVQWKMLPLDHFAWSHLWLYHCHSGNLSVLRNSLTSEVQSNLCLERGCFSALEEYSFIIMKAFEFCTLVASLTLCTNIMLWPVTLPLFPLWPFLFSNRLSLRSFKKSFQFSHTREMIHYFRCPDNLACWLPVPSIFPRMTQFHSIVYMPHFLLMNT